MINLHKITLGEFKEKFPKCHMCKENNYEHMRDRAKDLVCPNCWSGTKGIKFVFDFDDINSKIIMFIFWNEFHEFWFYPDKENETQVQVVDRTEQYSNILKATKHVLYFNNEDLGLILESPIEWSNEISEGIVLL